MTRITRRSLIVAGAATGVAGLVSRPATATPRPHGGTAFTNVTVIDPATARVIRNTTVTVNGDTITGVGGRVPAGTRIVDLRGRYMIPGLADMHTHGQAEGIDAPLYVANGVTTVRDMAGSLLAHDWRRRIEAGTLLGPRYSIGSRIVDGLPSVWNPAWLDIVQVGDPAAARAAVRDEIARGADFIKVYARVSRESYRALAAEAHRHGVPFVGHGPDAVPLEEAADLGQASVEHLFWTPFDTSSREREIRAEIQRIRLELGDYAGWFQAIHPLEWTAAHSHDRTKAKRLYAKLARRHMRQVPTLIMHKALDLARTLTLEDPRNKYLPPSLVDFQKFALQELYLKNRHPSEDPEWAAMFTFRLKTVKDMYEAGVPLMTGSDTGTVGVWPGFSIHDELALFVEAGIPPMATLKAATAEPATYLATNTGRIAPNHKADLAILNASPLADIHNTQSLSGVVVGGHYLNEQARQQLLKEVEQIASTTQATAAAPSCPCHTP